MRVRRGSQPSQGLGNCPAIPYAQRGHAPHLGRVFATSSVILKTLPATKGSLTLRLTGVPPRAFSNRDFRL